MIYLKLLFPLSMFLIFSWHPWGPGDQEERITRAKEQSVELNIPFVIGEFSHTTVGCEGSIQYWHMRIYQI